MLPVLPRLLAKKEASWTTTYLKQWVLEESTLPSGPIEVKVTAKESIPFSAVSDEQIVDLVACTTKRGHWWKVADMGRKNDFDVVFYRNSPSWLIFKYPKGFVVISILVFINEKERSKVRSLSWSRAKEISTIDVIR